MANDLTDRPFPSMGLASKSALAVDRIASRSSFAPPEYASMSVEMSPISLQQS